MKQGPCTASNNTTALVIAPKGCCMQNSSYREDRDETFAGNSSGLLAKAQSVVSSSVPRYDEEA